jgi:hypothetical protein
LIEQIRSGHYEYVFKTENSLLPSGNEQYSAKFSRPEAIENSLDFKKIINSKFKELFADSLCEFDTRAYQLNNGITIELILILMLVKSMSFII